MEDNKTSGSQQASQASGELWFVYPKSQPIVLILSKDAPVATPAKRSFPNLRGSAQQNQAIKNIATLISDALDTATTRLRAADGFKALHER